MGTRSKRNPRCSRCRMHTALCICPWLPRYDLSTRVVLVMHHKELTKTSATGPLALQCLSNSELRVHGVRDHRLEMGNLCEPDRRLLVLYPTEGAEVLSPEFSARDSRPVTLVVPDGNWQQASTMKRRLLNLDDAETVRLSPGEKTQWGLRREIKEEGLATFEAIARALGILESRTVQFGLETLFQLMVRRTLQSRGAVIPLDH